MDYRTIPLYWAGYHDAIENKESISGYEEYLAGYADGVFDKENEAKIMETKWGNKIKE